MILPHDGRYDHYLYAAKRTDKFLEKLWHTIQSTEGYKDNTVMLIVTDHGRGYTAQDWASIMRQKERHFRT